jgi:hypothetical protein
MKVERVKRPFLRAFSPIAFLLSPLIRAHIAQLAERLLGKDEVPGPNPGVGSILRRPTSGGAMQNFLTATQNALLRPARHEQGEVGPPCVMSIFSAVCKIQRSDM